MVNDLIGICNFFQDRNIIVLNKPPGMPVQVNLFPSPAASGKLQHLSKTFLLLDSEGWCWHKK